MGNSLKSPSQVSLVWYGSIFRGQKQNMFNNTRLRPDLVSSGQWWGFCFQREEGRAEVAKSWRCWQICWLDCITKVLGFKYIRKTMQKSSMQMFTIMKIISHKYAEQLQVPFSVWFSIEVNHQGLPCGNIDILVYG